MTTIPRTADYHEGTGVDLSAVKPNEQGTVLCPVSMCFAGVPASRFVAHLDWHAERDERIDRPRVKVRS